MGLKLEISMVLIKHKMETDLERHEPQSLGAFFDALGTGCLQMIGWL